MQNTTVTVPKTLQQELNQLKDKHNLKTTAQAIALALTHMNSKEELRANALAEVKELIAKANTILEPLNPPPATHMETLVKRIIACDYTLLMTCYDSFFQLQLGHTQMLTKEMLNKIVKTVKHPYGDTMKERRYNSENPIVYDKSTAEEDIFFPVMAIYQDKSYKQDEGYSKLNDGDLTIANDTLKRVEELEELLHSFNLNHIPWKCKDKRLKLPLEYINRECMYFTLYDGDEPDLN